jgi:hypothetical protein
MVTELIGQFKETRHGEFTDTCTDVVGALRGDVDDSVRA